MDGFSAFVGAAFWIAIAGIPIGVVLLAFLHAASVPQWAWAMSSRTQIWWLAGLLLGVALIPLGLPAAIWYLVKIRPLLNRIEDGNV
jgi:hypothetical protein